MTFISLYYLAYYTKTLSTQEIAVICLRICLCVFFLSQNQCSHQHSLLLHFMSFISPAWLQWLCIGIWVLLKCWWPTGSNAPEHILCCSTNISFSPCSLWRQKVTVIWSSLSCTNGKKIMALGAKTLQHCKLQYLLCRGGRGGTHICWCLHF